MTDTQTKIRSLFLTALMVVSVFGGTVAFAGGAAAQAGNGGADVNLESNSIIYQGQTAFAGGLAADTTYQLRSVDDDSTSFETEFTTDENGSVVLETSNLDADSYVVRGPGGNFFSFDNGTATNEGDTTSGSGNALDESTFEVAVQSLDVTADPTDVENEGSDTTTTIEVDSNRGGNFTATVVAEGLDEDDLAEIFGRDDADADEDDYQIVVNQNDDVTADFDGIDAGNYTLEFEVLDTTANDEVDIDVADTGGTGASFAQSVVTEERGDVAEFTVELQNTDSATIVIGGEDVNYESNFTVVDDNDDGEVTVQFNTFLPNSAAGISAADSDDDITDYNNNIARAGGRPLDTADYDLIAEIGGEEEALATLSITDSSVSEFRTWTSPQGDFGDAEDGNDILEAVEAGSVTQDNTIAVGDTLVHQLTASGIFGAFEAQSGSTPEAQFLNLVSRDDVDLTMVQTNPQANTDPLRLDLEDTPASAFNVVADAENNTLYVNVDTEEARFERLAEDQFPNNEDGNREIQDALDTSTSAGDGPGSNPFTADSSVAADTGDRFRVTFTLRDESTLTGDSDVAISTTFSVVERTVNWDTTGEDADGNDVVEVDSAAGQTVSGDTSVAPGTDFTIRARSQGDSPFLKSNETEVAADGSFEGTFDFNDVSSNVSFTLTIPNQGFDDNGEVDGIVSPAPTASVTINDQTTDGTTVTVASATLSDGGFVTIHDGSLLDGATFDSVRGTSDYLEPGDHSDIQVSLDTPYESSGTAIAMPHLDTNGNEEYDFVSSSGSADGPYTSGGSAVTADASLTVATPTPTATPPEETPTATPTATPDEGTPTPTDMSTPTPTDSSGQPGFGFAVAIVALVGAALLALRREN